MSRLVLAYDADCGPCTRFKRLVEFIDTKNQVDFIPLIEADESGLLDEIPRSERHASFHLVQPGGEVLNGAAAIPSLIKILPLGKAIAKVTKGAAPENQPLIQVRNYIQSNPLARPKIP